MELGSGGSGHGDGVGVGDSAGAVGAVSPEASSCTITVVAHAGLFLLVPSSGDTYKPREDSGVIHRPCRRRPRSNPEAPAQQSLLKPLSISHPSVVPVSLDGAETLGLGPSSATTTKIILDSRTSALGGPFSPGTTTGARPVWEVKGQPSREVSSCPWRTGETVPF